MVKKARLAHSATEPTGGYLTTPETSERHTALVTEEIYGVPAPTPGEPWEAQHLETWAQHPDYVGSGYEFSTTGKVRSRIGANRWGAYARKYWKRVKPISVNYRYWKVCLQINGARVDRKLHHLILETFVGKRPEGLVTRHLNDIQSDNRIENLAYGTTAENWEDRVRNNKKRKQKP